MKKAKIIMLTLALTLAFGMNANAQVKFGVRAGANLVNMKLTDGIGNLKGNNRAGFYVGPTVKFKLPVVGLGIDASAVYDQRTSDVEYTNQQGGTSSERVTARAISIPINARYGVGLGSVAEIFAFAGPQFGFNLSKSKSLGANEWTWSGSNFSVNVGIGATLLQHVEIKANYNIACGKTGEVSATEAVANAVKGTFKSKYNSWQLGVAYYF